MNDVYLCIYKHLDLKHMSILSKVNRDFNAIFHSEVLWYYFYLDKFDGEIIEDGYYNTCRLYVRLLRVNKIFYESTRLKLRDLVNETQILSININHLYKNTFVTEIGLMINLQKIQFYDCDIHTIPTEIGMLINLVKISFEENSIVTIPTEIGMLVNLVKMNFSCNYIENIPTEIGMMTSLTNIDFCNNNMSDIPNEICKLNNLKFVNFSFNYIKNYSEEFAKFCIGRDVDI